MIPMRLVLLLVAVVAHQVVGYPFEVPKSACEDMMPKGPGHNDAPAQNSKVPYDFSLDRTTIRSSDSVEFTIKQKPKGKPFAAFMVQARSGSSETPVGTFQPKGTNAQTVKCTKDNDTGSHNSPDPKTSVTFVWTPPTNFKGTVTFYATVAETKLKFWVRQKAGTVTVK